MPVQRGQQTQQVPIKIVGSSVYGIYDKMSTERTINMTISDDALVVYPGYKVGLNNSLFDGPSEGRGLYASSKLNALYAVFDNRFYQIKLEYDHITQEITNQEILPLGTLDTLSGPVYFAENNKPQILISDGAHLYLYDPLATPVFKDIVTDFTPGYITFHDTYFLAAASQDTIYSPAANNTWRLSAQNDGSTWLSIAQTVGLLETKPDNTQAVIRFPSKGNMILVMGKTVTEMWFDTGAQLFPYQRQDQGSIDYGCINPATVAFMDEIVIWLAVNEKSGPIIMYTTGGLPTKITTDGIDFQLSQLNNPEISQGFLYRKNGHLFYHLNFYQDNISFVVDLTLNKIYQACDQNSNYYAMGQVVWYNNQYFSVSKNDGNFYIFDTVFNTYQTTDQNNNLLEYEIPRIRICNNIRLPSQDYFILNDIGFTIETGETDYQYINQGPIFILAENGNKIITEGTSFLFIQTENGDFIEFENGNLLVSENDSDGSSSLIIAAQDDMVAVTPRVDMSISYDGGASFSSDFAYNLNPIGKRRNRLMWWQLGLVNDAVPQFKFWGIGRVVAMDGVANIRQ